MNYINLIWKVEELEEITFLWEWYGINLWHAFKYNFNSDDSNNDISRDSLHVPRRFLL